MTIFSSDPCPRCGGKQEQIYDGYGVFSSCVDEVCRMKEREQFWNHISEVAYQTRLKPVHLGGKGLGVLCPRCKGNGYVAKPESEV